MALEVTPLAGTVYLAPPGCETELAEELGRGVTRLVPDSECRLLLAPGPPRPSAWAANTWIDPVRVRFDSIADGATALFSLGLRWALLPTSHHRRAALIAEKLPRTDMKPLVFPAPAPTENLGSWTLAEPNVLFAAARCTSPFPNGEALFVEDHVRPPSRAYLKLWEALTIAGRLPKPGDRCVDLGSSPGGWTWVLEKLGGRVMSVDKAPIDASLTRLTRVRYVQDSAFAIDPAKVGRVDWMVSDVICYPERIVRLIHRWLAVHPNANYVVTIKLQGKTDMAPLAELKAIHGSRLVHLHHNKHELTWVKLGYVKPEVAEED